MIRVKLREVFDVKKFVCCFVSIVFMLISLFIPVVSADEIDSLSIDTSNYKGFIDGFNYDSEFYQLYDEYRDEVFDSAGYIDFSGFCFKESSTTYDYYFISGVYLSDGGIKDSAFVPLLDESTGLYNISCTNSYYDAENNRYRQYIIRLSHNKNTGDISFWSNSNIQQSFFYNSNNEIITWNPDTMLSNIDKYKTSNATSAKDISTYQLIPFGSAWDNAFKRLTFDVQPQPYINMDLNGLSNTFTITATNTTSNKYDYMVYISEKPSNVGVVNSFNQSKWFMSSKQWCYQWLNDYSALNGNINDYIVDNIADGIKGADILDYTFGSGMYNTLFNAWGGAFDGAKEYFSVDDETMSFYQVSQTNCPVYRINANDTKTHTISYSSLGLELGKTYYLNIIYTPVDFKAYSAMTAPIVDAGTGQQGNYPVFDTRDIAKYTVYDSYEFSVSNGVFSQDSNTLYSYSDLIKYTNPSNSTAKIESDDDEIIVSDNDSYDNSVSTSYINYGQIYHGCTFYNGTSGGSGGSGGLVEENIELKIYGVDDLDFELTQLSEPVSKFQLFMQSVFGFLPEEMVGLFILGISTCVICRILGR